MFDFKGFILLFFIFLKIKYFGKYYIFECLKFSVICNNPTSLFHASC
jgi:hypothetical protein